MGNFIRRQSAPTKRGASSAAGPETYYQYERTERRCARRDGESMVTNPFLAFFLRLRNRKPRVHVAKLARIAGKRWRQMSDEQRRKYVQQARQDKRRRVVVSEKPSRRRVSEQPPKRRVSEQPPKRRASTCTNRSKRTLKRKKGEEVQG